MIPGLTNFNKMITANMGAIFNEDSIDTIHNLVFQYKPTYSDSTIHLDLVAMIKFKNIGLKFEAFTVEYNPSAKNLSDYKIIKNETFFDHEMNFEVFVGLIDRKVVIEDNEKEIKMVFPIGVGAFDEGIMNLGKTSLLTPRFQNGFLDKRVVISKREKPKYFKGKPFIRVLKGSDIEKDSTPIGFHIEINNEFVRGFDSHGCMRLREIDLMAFHDLIMMGSDQQIPLKILYTVKESLDSPILKRNSSYKTISNVGTKQNPYFILGRDFLIELNLNEKTSAPVSLLLDNSKDNYENMYSYETEEKISEQNTRRENQCKSMVLSGEIGSDDKSISKCVDAIKRKNSLGDDIYRKYMGIDSGD